MTVAGLQEKEDSLKEDPPVICKSIRYYFREYCNCSSIHGFRYFGEKRTYFERIWWFIVFSLVFAVCVYQIKAVYHKWEMSPVIVSFDTSETPIHSIPFPAVTICPEAKSRLALYNHTDIMIKLSKRKSGNVNLTEEEETNALYMSMICDLNRRGLKQTLTFSDDFFDFINRVSVKNFVFSCYWMGNSSKCNDLFVPIITDEGICYTFNMLHRDDIFRENVVHFKNFMQNPDRRNKSLNWNMDDGYKSTNMDEYPRRAKFPGVKSALQITLAAYDDELDATCKDSLQGFRVILHTPMRIPRPSSQYFRIPLDEAVLGSVHPSKISTSETVKVYNPERRECYFPSERQLKYFKIYTQLNCHLECLTEFTLKMCNCVNFYMPRNNGTKICGSSKKPCIDATEKYLQTIGLERSMEDLKNKNKPKKDNTTETSDVSSKRRSANDENIKVPNCDCKPICSDLSYHVETSQAKWDWKKKYNALYPYRNYKKMHLSRLTLYFKTSQFVTSKRHELYGPTDFLANFGGLLGLFTGFSVLSIMELFYFLTIRLCCNVRLYGKWYGPER